MINFVHIVYSCLTDPYHYVLRHFLIFRNKWHAFQVIRSFFPMLLQDEVMKT